MRFQAQAVEKYGIIMAGGVFVGILVVFVGFHIPASWGCYQEHAFGFMSETKAVTFQGSSFRDIIKTEVGA